MGKLVFKSEDSGKMTETVDEIVKYLREKAKTVSEKEWDEIWKDVRNLI